MSGRILLTGGSGRLGSYLRDLLPNVVAPSRTELDVTRPHTIVAALDRYHPAVVVHAAAYTNVREAERDRATCWAVNVGGTRNHIRALAGRETFLVHISTDYVFSGAEGGYAEDDVPGPTRNYYGLTKLAAEEIARCAERHLIIRTSFRPSEWPYSTAFTDVYTSQDYIDVIAPEIALAIRRCTEVGWDTLHIATERKSVYDLARRRCPGVHAGSKGDAGVDLPRDVSLDIARWRELKSRWG